MKIWDWNNLRSLLQFNENIKEIYFRFNKCCQTNSPSALKCKNGTLPINENRLESELVWVLLYGAIIFRHSVRYSNFITLLVYFIVELCAVVEMWRSEATAESALPLSRGSWRLTFSHRARQHAPFPVEPVWPSIRFCFTGLAFRRTGKRDSFIFVGEPIRMRTPILQE